MSKRGPSIDPTLEVRPVTVSLDDRTMSMARVLGKNLSDGLRNAVRTAYRAYQATPDTPSEPSDARTS